MTRHDMGDLTAALRDARYAVLVTQEGHGTATESPIWFALDADSDRLYLHSAARSAMVERIRANPNVSVFASGPAGEPLGPTIAGVARVLTDSAAISRADAALTARLGAERAIYDRVLLRGEPSVYLEVASPQAAPAQALGPAAFVATSARRRLERRWWTLIGVCVATIMLLLDITVVNVALPSIRRDLGASFEDLQWVVDAYALTLAAFVLTSGSLADRLGRRRLFIIGIVIFTAASAACALSFTPLMLNLSRAVQGVGGAVMFAVSLALLAQEFRGQERIRATAIYGASIGAAVAAGPLVGGALTDGLGWEWIFWINVPVGVIALVIAIAQVIESRDPDARGVDWLGTVTFSLANGLLILALLRGNAEGWGSTLVAGSLGAATVLLVAFVIIQMRIDQPMLPLHFFRNGSFTGAQIGAFAVSASMFALFLYITLYLQNILGEDALSVGLMYLPSTVVAFVVSGATASIMGRVPPAVLLSLGLALTGIGLLTMTGRSEGDEWVGILPGAIIAGVGVGLVNPVIANLALSTVPDSQSGVAAGANDTFRQVGVATGVAALGALLLGRATSHIEQALSLPREEARLLADGVAAGALDGDVPAIVLVAARQGFLEGFNDVVLVGGALALLGALACAALVRSRDLIVHEQ